MTRLRISQELLGVGIFLWMLTGSGLGQSCMQVVTCSGSNNIFNGGCVPEIPANASNCWASAPFQTSCWVNNTNCSPGPECPTCNGKAKAQAGSPIDLGSGDTDISQTDIRIPGLGGGLTLTRTWNSVWPPTESGSRFGLFGPNWRSTYEERIFPGIDGYMKYSRGDGSFWSFGFAGYDATGNLPKFLPTSPANQSVTLVQSASWTLTFQNGETRTFDRTSGYLTTITDRNGNTTLLAYDNASRLVSVTDPAGHHLNFSYAGSNTYLIVGVSSDVGVSLSYAYDGQGRLSTVTKPDSTTTSFQYDSNSFISAVLDSNGKVLESHTYDVAGKGLTSSRAGGAEAITVTYPQPPQFKGTN
jgi:YD repeat-containing protein